MFAKDDLYLKFSKIVDGNPRCELKQLSRDLGISESDLFNNILLWKTLGYRINWQLFELLPNGFPSTADSNLNTIPTKIIIETDHQKLSEDRMETQNIKLEPNESKALDQLAQELGIIPCFPKLDIYTFGYTEKDGHIIELKINQRNLVKLPDAIGEFPQLKILNLNNNRLTTLPDSIGNLRSLEFLDLSVNQLNILPDSVGNLLNLKELNINGTLLNNLPESIGNLKNLEKLILRGNNLASLPNSIGNLVVLKELNLNKNKLSTLPESFWNLTSLRSLNLGSNRFNTLSEKIASLAKLKELNLQNNPIKSFTPAMQKILIELQQNGCMMIN
jgi:Leucine-rich repeat (LRR) protein